MKARRVCNRAEEGLHKEEEKGTALQKKMLGVGWLQLRATMRPAWICR